MFQRTGSIRPDFGQSIRLFTVCLLNLYEPQIDSLLGPISSVTVMGQAIIIVNDYNIALDLLDKRSAVYSDRPVLPFAGEM